MERSAELIADALDAVCVIALLDGEGKSVYPVGVHDPDAGRLAVYEELFGSAFAAGAGLAGEAMRRREPQLVTGLTLGDVRRLRPELEDIVTRSGLSSAVAVPLEGPSQLLGVVWVGRSGDAPAPGPEEVAFAADAARLVGLAVEAHLLREALEQRSEATSPGPWDRPADQGPDGRALETLSSREADVLRQIARGHTNREAADHLGLSVRTVEWHRARIQWKLDVTGRAGLTHAARRLGLAGDA